MARNSGHNPYGEQDRYGEQGPYDEQGAYGGAYGEPRVDAFDEDASGREYDPAPAAAEEDYYHPDDMPLFLSSDEPEPKHRFGSGGDRGLRTPLDWPKILKLGALTAAAAGIALAIVSMENPLAVFADAKASLNGTSASSTSASQPGLTQTAAVEPAVAARAAISQPAPAAAPSTVGTAPTRDEIALALRTAHQAPPETRAPEVRQPEVRQPEVRQPAAVAPSARRMDPDEVAALLKRAKGLIAVGDISPARLLLERAADAQEASAALLLAQTYDPAVLGTRDMRSIKPDPAMARSWYQKAARLGSTDAQQRLAQMQN
ncbi:hypothetical protein [Bradyrhizobium sp.]|uniref:hypothetical protein n=1 Tax=Bradyrhizobium sp. TaxID=376 RepID=UPI003C709FC5